MTSEKLRIKAGKAIAPYGRCPSCNHIERVPNLLWYRAARPRCQACGDFLVPGTAHVANHYLVQDRGLISAANAERASLVRQLAGGRTGAKAREHNCFIKGCKEHGNSLYALCQAHGQALLSIDRRLFFRIQGRFKVFHGARWKVRPKALSMWNILLASASHKLSVPPLTKTPPIETIEGDDHP